MRRIAAKLAGGCLRHTGHSGMSASCPLCANLRLCWITSLAIAGRNREMNLGLRKDHKRSMIFTSCGRNFSAPNSVQRGEFIN